MIEMAVIKIDEKHHKLLLLLIDYEKSRTIKRFISKKAAVAFMIRSLINETTLYDNDFQKKVIERWNYEKL